LYNRLKF
jgi:hypothetical protein